ISSSRPAPDDHHEGSSIAGSRRTTNQTNKRKEVEMKRHMAKMPRAQNRIVPQAAYRERWRTTITHKTIHTRSLRLGRDDIAVVGET
ncbi:MAG: hypothetical protein WD208_05880, partial [Dehalococcoidia bacterium]